MDTLEPCNCDKHWMGGEMVPTFQRVSNPDGTVSLLYKVNWTCKHGKSGVTERRFEFESGLYTYSYPWGPRYPYPTGVVKMNYENIEKVDGAVYVGKLERDMTRDEDGKFYYIVRTELGDVKYLLMDDDIERRKVYKIEDNKLMLGQTISNTGTNVTAIGLNAIYGDINEDE